MAQQDPREALRLAVAGLEVSTQLSRDGEADDPESQLLLLREMFKAHLRSNRPRSAHAIARKMIRLGTLSEVAHADHGRASVALGWFAQAAQSYRLAARFAPANRRAVHWAACGMALWHAARFVEAQSAIERALRWSTTTRPLHRAQLALLAIELGEVPEDLHAITADLDASRVAEGYGKYILGLLAHQRGDSAKMRVFLQAFVERSVRDPLRAATLAGEIQTAQRLLKTSDMDPSLS
ncbi:MAG: tetratricopeptide repeat protein [Deltaproteobacteria bacterium]|nr:tetratricopeptide repeat protein [Deltaproteobacteria bacterium]